jgi:hypothetical protein
MIILSLVMAYAPAPIPKYEVEKIECKNFGPGVWVVASRVSGIEWVIDFKNDGTYECVKYIKCEDEEIRFQWSGDWEIRPNKEGKLRIYTRERYKRGNDNWSQGGDITYVLPNDPYPISYYVKPYKYVKRRVR